MLVACAAVSVSARPLSVSESHAVLPSHEQQAQAQQEKRQAQQQEQEQEQREQQQQSQLQPQLNSLATSADADLPLVSHIWTADPAGHVFDGTLWVYTSHDQDKRPRGAADGADSFNMRDYRAFSFAHPKSRGRDEGVLLSLEDVPWASKQLWAPDVTRDAHGVFHLFFPAKDSEGLFRIGHAQADHPQGPFVADETPLADSLSIDPAVFVDDEEGEQPGQAFLLFGGLWGGQLEYLRGEMDAEHAPIPPSRCALAPMMAPLAADMKSFVVPPRLVVVRNPDGSCIREAQTDRRFFEGAWVSSK